MAISVWTMAAKAKRSRRTSLSSDVPHRRKRKRGSPIKGAVPKARLDKRARGGSGIKIKPSHEGLLHENMGIPADKPISMAKLEKEKAHASPAKKKRIVFAENAKKWHH